VASVCVRRAAPHPAASCPGCCWLSRQAAEARAQVSRLERELGGLYRDKVVGAREGEGLMGEGLGGAWGGGAGPGRGWGGEPGEGWQLGEEVEECVCMLII
jgi:hypothetical protein